MSEQQKNDKQAFEEFLNKHSEVSDAYARLSGHEPSSQLDEAILAASRRAVQARPQSVTAGFYQRWKRPLSMAASVVLCVALVTVYYEQTSEVMLRQPALMPPPTESSLAKTVQAERDQQVSADVPVTAGAADKSPVLLSGDTGASPLSGLDTARSDRLAEQKKAETAWRQEQDGRQQQRAAKRRQEESAALFAEHATPVESSRPEPMSVETERSEIVPGAPAATSVIDRYELQKPEKDALPKQALALKNRIAAAPSAKESASTAMRQLPTPAEALQVAPDRYYAQQDSLSASVGQPGKERIELARRLLLKISHYRATGHFQQADTLLRQFHQRYPDFPATEREQLLDSVAPLIPQQRVY